MKLKVVTNKCITCDRVLPLGMFPTYKNRKGSVLHFNQCKECRSSYKHQHYVENRESYLDRSKKHRESNPEAYKDYLKNYYRSNRTALLLKDKEYALEHREHINEYHREHRKRPENVIKEKARKMVHLAIEFGMLVRPNVCSKCGVSCFCEAHHKDYTKPLEVDWLCKKCHESEHHLNEGDTSKEYLQINS